MLKAHQACIDLEKGVLRIQGREVKFLAEHELPEKARDEMGLDPGTQPPSSSSAAGPSSAPQQPSFPGSGNTLGTAPQPGQPGRGRGAPPAVVQASRSRHSEEAINTLMALGVSREVAISTLDAAGGNLDVAASLLF